MNISNLMNSLQLIKKKHLYKPSCKHNNYLNTGTLGIYTISEGTIKFENYNSIKRTTLRVLKPFKGKLIIRIWPLLSITKKPKEVRMGKGSGKVDKWIFFVKPNQIILEMNNVKLNKSTKIIRIIKTRLSIKTKIITNQIMTNSIWFS